MYTDAARVAATTAVTSDDSVFSVLAANSTRKSATVFNNSDKILYLGYNSDVADTKFKVSLQPGESWDMPHPYTGIVYGICEAGPTGSIMATEEN